MRGLWRSELYQREIMSTVDGVLQTLVGMKCFTVGRPALKTILKRLMKNFWLTRARKFVKNYIKACIECCYYKEPMKKECEIWSGYPKFSI